GRGGVGGAHRPPPPCPLPACPAGRRGNILDRLIGNTFSVLAARGCAARSHKRAQRGASAPAASFAIEFSVSNRPKPNRTKVDAPDVVVLFLQANRFADK